MKHPGNPDPASIQCRRSFLTCLDLGGMPLGGGRAGRADKGDEQVIALERPPNESDSGSLYPQIKTLADQCRWDDIRTVDYLHSRSEVDTARIGCLGISMGGDRTDYLAGLDERIKCAVSVGWMSTLRSMIKQYVEAHSFIHFLPGLTHFRDLPDLLGCMVPKPLMVMQCSKDQLYPLEGMQEAVDKLTAIYAKSSLSALSIDPWGVRTI